jgi:hypothetical protein
VVVVVVVVVVGGFEGVELGEEAHGGVVEEAGEFGGGFY